MQFQCARCHSKYQISDEKVRGKTIKVRCKSCGAMIVVKGQHLSNKSAFSELEDTSLRTAAQTPSATAMWYVSIQRSKHGPISESEVLDLLENGKVNARSYAWTNGMSDWQRIGTIPEFNRAAAASDTDTKSARPAGIDAKDDSAPETEGDASHTPANDDTIAMDVQTQIDTAEGQRVTEATSNAAKAELAADAQDTTRRFKSSDALTDDVAMKPSRETTDESVTPHHSLTPEATDETTQSANQVTTEAAPIRSVISPEATDPEIATDIFAANSAVGDPGQTMTDAEGNGELVTVPEDSDSIVEATPPPIPAIARRGNSNAPTDETADSITAVDSPAQDANEEPTDRQTDNECADDQNESTSEIELSVDEDDENERNEKAELSPRESNVDDTVIMPMTLALEDSANPSLAERLAQMVEANTNGNAQQETNPVLPEEDIVGLKVTAGREDILGGTGDIAEVDEFDDADDSFFSEGDLQAAGEDESGLFPTSGKMVDLGDLIPDEAVEPSRDEAKQLAQEFSLMIQLNKKKNRNRTVFAMFALLVVAGIAALLVVQEQRLEERQRVAAERRANAVEYVPPNDEEQPTYAAVKTEEVEPENEKQEARTFAVEVAIETAEETENKKRTSRSRSRRKKSKGTSENTTPNVDPLSGPSVVSRSFGKSEAGIALKAGGATKAPGEAVTDEEISRLISRRMKKFTQCKRRNAMESMKVRLKFAIQASGVVTDVKVTVVGGEDKFMQGCVRNLASKWRFPPQPTSKTFSRTLLL